MCCIPCAWVIGRAGARQTRRWILRRSVGWRPPDVRPSGAGLARGTRVCCSLFTPSRVAPHRGGVSADDRSPPRETGCWASTGLGLWRQRDLLGDGPQTRAQFPRHGDDPLGGVCPAGAQRPIAGAQADLSLLTELLDGRGHRLQAPLEMPTDVGRVARGPGAFDQCPAGMGVPRLGDAALTAPVSGGVFRGRQAEITPQRSGGLDTGEVPQVGHGRHGDRTRDATEGLEGVDHWPEPPGVHMRVECVFQALQAFGVFGHGADVCLEDDGRC